MTESGRARYTNSNRQGLSEGLSAHWRLCSFLSASMKTASPGAMSRTKRKPMPSSATDSEAIRYSVPCSVSLMPRHSGRMPNGSEGQQADAGDLRDGRVAATYAAVQHGDGFKDGVGVDHDAGGGLLDFVGQHVQQHFRVGVGVDVAAVVLEHLFFELFPVGQVAVVGQGNAERRVDVERLRFLFAGRAGGRIAAVADARVALQRTHIAGAENVTHQAVGLVHGKHTAVIGRDPRRILAAVLQQQQSVVQQLIDRLMGNDADDATHGVLLDWYYGFKEFKIARAARGRPAEKVSRCAHRFRRADSKAHCARKLAWEPTSSRTI